MHERLVAADVRALGTHWRMHAAARPRILQGNARRTSSAWMDGWMAKHRRLPCAISCHQVDQVSEPGDLNAHLRRADDGSAQRSQMGRAAVTVVGTGAAGPHLSLNGVPTTLGQHLLLPAGSTAGRHSTNRAPEFIKWIEPAVPSERRTVATAMDIPQVCEVVPRFVPKSRDVSLVEGRNFVTESWYRVCGF